MAYITLKKNHFFNNLDIIAKLASGKDKIALVLKDNAYGHGLCEIANMAKEYGIKKAVVRTYNEAKEIEEFFDYILVLADTPKKQSDIMRYTINDLAQIDKFPEGTKVELKVNTGMNRNGIERHELSLAFEKIMQKSLNLEGIFTHHSCADERGCVFEEQNKNFAKIKQESEELAHTLGILKLRFHSANSAALFRETNFNEDMARVGIAAYGCLELEGNPHASELKPVLSVYAKKISSRTLQEGEAIGYGATHKLRTKSVVSNYDFGYGDGFMRICSDNYTTPESIPLLGRISMDNSSFLSEKEELLIFNDAREIAKSAKTISYEMLTSLKPSIARDIV